MYRIIAFEVKNYYLRSNLRKKPIVSGRPNFRSWRLKWFFLNIWLKEINERIFMVLDLKMLRTYFKIDAYKFHCQEFRSITWISLPFTFGKISMTKSFMGYVVQLMAMRSILALARFVGRTLMKNSENIHKSNFSKVKQFSFKKLWYISVEEIAIKRGISTWRYS